MAKKNRFKPRFTGSALDNELSGRITYEKPKFDEQGNKIDPNKQEVIAGGLPFQAAFNPASLSISNRAGMADGGFINQFFGENSTLNKYIDKGKSFLGLDNDVSGSPNVEAAMDKKPIESISGNNNIYSSRIANQNDVTSDTRYIAPNPTEKPVDLDAGTSSDPASEVRPREEYNLTAPSLSGKNDRIISLTPGKSMSLNTPNMQGDIDKQKSQMQSTFTKSDNKIRGSKSRFGLFGNYGKDVEVRKTYDPETNKITRSKFVNGEEVQKGKGFKGVRKAKRAGSFGRKRNK
jgi:hypothetical protein